MVASFVMAVLLVFCWIPKADAGWVLYFRNGSSVEVSSYKEVGGVVSYPRFGGTVSVSKSVILRIEATGVDANRNDGVVEVQKQQTTAEEEQDAKRRRAEFVERVKRGEVKSETATVAPAPAQTETKRYTMTIQAGPFDSFSECGLARASAEAAGERVVGYCHRGSGLYNGRYFFGLKKTFTEE